MTQSQDRRHLFFLSGIRLHHNHVLSMTGSEVHKGLTVIQKMNFLFWVMSEAMTNLPSCLVKSHPMYFRNVSGAFGLLRNGDRKF